MPKEQQWQPEAPALEAVLADLDAQRREGWSMEAPPLEEVLDVLEADTLRDEAKEEADAVRSSFVELGKIDEAFVETGIKAPTVLRAARQRRPKANFKAAIDAESPLKPWNDFVEEKQDGMNSYEERQARSAAIQAKLQAARNRLSLVRYQRDGSASSAALPQLRSSLHDTKPSQEVSHRKPKASNSHKDKFGFEEHFVIDEGWQDDGTWSWLQPKS